MATFHHFWSKLHDLKLALKIDSMFTVSVIYKFVSSLIVYLEGYEFGHKMRGYHLNAVFLHHEKCSKCLEICQAVT